MVLLPLWVFVFTLFLVLFCKHLCNLLFVLCGSVLFWLWRNVDLKNFCGNNENCRPLGLNLCRYFKHGPSASMSPIWCRKARHWCPHFNAHPNWYSYMGGWEWLQINTLELKWGWGQVTQAVLHALYSSLPQSLKSNEVNQDVSEVYFFSFSAGATRLM